MMAKLKNVCRPYPFLDDKVWFDAVRPHFSGNLIVGRDLMEL
jgi:hypothetical protein